MRGTCRNCLTLWRITDTLWEPAFPPQASLIAVMDCTFVAKSGHHTYGVDVFYPSTHSKLQSRLEFSTLAVVDVDYHTAYTLSIRQIPAPIVPTALGTTRTRASIFMSSISPKTDRHSPQTFVISWSMALMPNRNLWMAPGTLTSI